MTYGFVPEKKLLNTPILNKNNATLSVLICYKINKKLHTFVYCFVLKQKYI